MNYSVHLAQQSYPQRLDARRLSRSEAGRLWASVGFMVAACDVLIFQAKPGISAGVLGLCFLAVLVWNRPRCVCNLPGMLIAGLIVGLLVQSAIDVGWTMVPTLMFLFSALIGRCLASAVGAGTRAIPLGLITWLQAPMRWLPFLRESPFAGSHDEQGRPGWTLAQRTLSVVVPTALVLLPFLALVASGNAVVGTALSAWMKNLTFPSAGRWMFWILSATVAIGLLFPNPASRSLRRWTRTWPNYSPERDPLVAQWRTWIGLGLLNVLFLWANTTDAVFLWFHAALPRGVTYSQFVHSGITSLIAATVLAGGVLAVAFQQDRTVSRHPATRALALIWLVQNLVLTAGAALRLKLYVDAYDLSVERLGVIAFLLLICVGLGLSAYRIMAGKSLDWLIASNAVAVTAMFYVAQFIDFRGITARYNTRQWLSGQSKEMDISYLEVLGAPSYPCLKDIVRERPRSQEARSAAATLAAEQARGSAHVAWQSWQWREASLRKEVFSK